MDKKVKDLLSLMGRSEIPSGYKADVCKKHGVYLYREDIENKCIYCRASEGDNSN